MKITPLKFTAEIPAIPQYGTQCAQCAKSYTVPEPVLPHFGNTVGITVPMRNPNKL